MNGTFPLSGSVGAEVFRAQKAPLSWRLKNTLRKAYITGWLNNKLAVLFTRATGIPTLISQLSMTLIKADGQRIDYGVIDRKLVTQNGVGFIVDDWVDDTTDITNMSFHGCGTGTTAAANDDTGLETEATTVTDRVDGTQSQPSYNVLRSIGTQTFTGAAAITEHGLHDIITESSGVLWDHHVFAAINVVNTDSIQWTYEATLAPET